MSIYDKASLVLIPSGTKTSKVYSQVPTNGDGDFTFSRSTAATRVNADGNIEKETQNLLLQSNSFDTTWGKQNATLTSGQSGYDGNDAWFIQSNTANGGHRLTQTFSTSGVYTFSVYAKAGGYNYLALYSAGKTQGRYFDLANGLVGNTMLGTPVDSKIESVGSGWYRCSVTFSGTEASIEMWMSESGSSYIFTGDGTSGVYIQDAQLEQGLVARDYIETTTAAVEGGITDNVPRLDYTDSSCPALLLEPQRRNILPHSEYFESWNKQNVSLDFGYLSPEGVNNAYKVTKTSTLGHLVDTTTGNNTGKIKSIWARTTSGTGTAYLCNNNSESAALFDITEEWKRFDIAHSGADFFYAVDFRGSATLDEIILWGAQVEDDGAGGGTSYATSYIPTYGTSVTRNADSCLGAGDANTFNSTAGVLYWEGSFDSTSTIAGAIALIGGGSNRVQLYNSGTSLVALIQVNGSAIWSQSTSGTIDITSNHKYAIKWALNDFALWIDGVEFAVNSSGATFSDSALTELRFSDFGASYLYAKTNQVLTFNTALSDTELADLTTI